MDQKSIANTVYHSAVLSALTITYSMVGKKFFSMKPVDVSKVDAMDAVKLVVLVSSANFTKSWLTTQGILPPNVMNSV